MATMSRTGAPFLVFSVFSLFFVVANGVEGPVVGDDSTTPEPEIGDCVQSDLCRDKLLVIGLDGFRYDYLDAFRATNFEWLAAGGVRAVNGVRPAFVTKTFPNLWTIATGLYVENHGIIDNSFYDPELKAKFHMSDRNSSTDPRWWAQATPIWVAAKQAGKRSGVYFWAGSEAPGVNGTRPDIYREFSNRVSLEQRVNTVSSWLADDQVDLAMVYFDEPDTTGHEFGAWSREVRDKIAELDRMMGHFLSSLQKSGCLDKLNILVVSDHGMTDIVRGGTHVLSLSDYVDLKEDIVDIPQSGTLAGIIPKPGREAAVFEQLSHGRNWTVYFKDQIPERFHYKNNVRVPPIVMIPDEGFVISRGKTYEDRYIGQHGYDNELKSMRPLFVARGPGLGHGVQIKEPFDTVNLFPLMCHLLKISCPASDGNLNNVKQALKR